MGRVIPFEKPKTRPRGLCQHGYHRWQVVKNNHFDSKQGKLVTVWVCTRCGQRKVKAI